MAQRGVLTSNAMSAAIVRFSDAFPIILVNRIRRSLLVGSLAYVRYVAVFVLSIALPMPVLIVCLWRTLYQVLIVGPEVSADAIIVMLRVGLDGSALMVGSTSVCLFTGVWSFLCAVGGVLVVIVCLEVFPSSTTTVTLRFGSGDVMIAVDI